jgi:ribonuclease P protein component
VLFEGFPMKLITLRKRREFLRIRGGGRCSTHAFVLETKPRELPIKAAKSDTKPIDNAPHFGFTVTKKLGNAVTRNRIRRRLKAAVSQVAVAEAKEQHDYVLIARKPALDLPFNELTELLETAFKRVLKPSPKSKQRRRKVGIGPGAPHIKAFDTPQSK